MREKIILAPGVSGTEILRTMAKFGVNTMGVRFMNAVELSKTALARSGVSTSAEFLTRREEPSVIFSFLNEIPYFSAASYADAENLSSALQTIRGMVTEDDEASGLHDRLSKGDFAEKNSAIAEVYDEYISACESSARIDSIGLVRKAIEASDPFDSDFILLEEFPLSPLEEKLLNKLSSGSVVSTSITEVFERERVDIKGLSYMEGYGAINEVEHILTGIMADEIPLDECVIACAAPAKYSQIFYDLSQQYCIPVTYGSGIPITDSNPARLLQLIYKWDTDGYNGIDALRNIFLSDAFDREILFDTLGLEDTPSRRDLEDIVKAAGSLRISFDSKANAERLSKYSGKLLDIMRVLAEEFEAGISSFIEKYSVIRPDPAGRIDRSAINVITDFLDAYTQNVPDGDINRIIPKLLEKTVSSEISREGALHVTSIGGAFASIRKHVYICGLSANEFPGTPAENYLLLDGDLTAFSCGSDFAVPTSENRIAARKQTLTDLLSFASALGISSRLSYSGYDLSELKDQNPSSVLFSYYEIENPRGSMSDLSSAIEHVPYFADRISGIRYIGKAYADGSKLSSDPCFENMPDPANALEREWSPSALEIFFRCPRRFYLKYIAGIPEEEPDDPFTVINAADFGTLAHSMMEALAGDTMTAAGFHCACGKAFDDFLCRRPPLHANAAAKSRHEFLMMMDLAFDRDPHNEVLAAEESYSFKHPSGISLHGYPDRVEKDPTGKYIIADFKTKRKVEHVSDDIDSCLQVVIYAWMCGQAGIDIDHCEYRYLRKGLTVPCVYDDTIKDKLNDKLETFRDAIEKNSFPRVPGKQNTNCRYCRMKDICRWPGDDEGNEAQDEQ